MGFLWPLALILSFSPDLLGKPSTKFNRNTIVLSEEIYLGKPLGSYFEYFMNHGGDATIDEVTSGEFDDQFKVSSSASLGFGFNTDPIWLRCTIKNPGEEVAKFFLEVGYSHLDQIALYIPTTEGHYSVRNAGDKKPFRDREVNHHNFIFKLSQAPGTATYYIRIQTSSSLSILLASLR